MGLTGAMTQATTIALVFGHDSLVMAQQLLPLLYRSDSPALLRVVGDETGHEIKRRVSDLLKRGHDSVMMENVLRPIDDRTL